MTVQLPCLSEWLSTGIQRLHEMDVEPVISFDDPVDERLLSKFQDEFDLPLPQEIQHLYAETDGFCLSWESDGEWGDVAFPNLNELRLFRQRWVNGGFAATGRPFEQVSDWLPFQEIGNGDLVCVEANSGVIVQFDHESTCEPFEWRVVYADSFPDYLACFGKSGFRSTTLLDLSSAMYGDQNRVIWPRR